MLRVFVVLLLLLQDVFCVRALARTTMVRVVLRVRSKFGERERVFIFLAAAALLSFVRLFPFFFVSSLFFSLVSSSFSSFWRRTNAAPQTTLRSREKKEGEVRKRVLLPLWYYVRTAPITPFSLSLSLSVSLCLKIWFLLSR